ncbi:MAG: type II secretion system secretin GspD, partial [Rhodanobacter sp.]
QELADDERMVRTFDVDWLRGTSVGVFNLQYAKVGELMPKLDALFGEHGSTPLAGMLRFIPIERTNALVVISTQPDYLREVGEWISKIDAGGGNQPQLFVYDVRNLKAADLAKYLAQIYTNGAGSGNDQGGQVGPGLSSGTLGSADNTNAASMGSTAGSFGNTGTGAGAPGSGGLNGSSGSALGGSGGDSRDGSGSGLGSNGTGVGGSMSAGASSTFGSNGQGAGSGANSQQYASSDGSVRISSVDANNQLLVRARPSQWEEIKHAIDKLDNVPLQVQIETRILEVRLTGQFQFGVQWYLKGLVGSSEDANGNFIPGSTTASQYGALGKGGPSFGGEPFFYSFLNHNMQVAVRAMETSGNTKTLSAPSMVVMNNQVGSIQVGDRIPINQTSVNTGIGTATSFNQVEYLDTGVILNVQPRINPGGLVYMNINQQVSQPNNSIPAINGNKTISQRKLATQVAVQSGQTVLLGGLIQQAEGSTDTGIPGLNRVPVLGRLFGNTNRNRNRTELIVLITPRVIRGSEDARQITDDYQNKFESLAPLRASANGSVVTAGKTMAPASFEPPAPAVITPLPMAAGAGWAEQLQQHAEQALRQRDDASAQDLAMQSWKQGSHRGALCERNWQVIVQARTRSKRLGSVDSARRQEAECRRPSP